MLYVCTIKDSGGRSEQEIKVLKGRLGTIMKMILRDARLDGKVPDDPITLFFKKQFWK